MEYLLTLLVFLRVLVRSVENTCRLTIFFLRRITFLYALVNVFCYKCIGKYYVAHVRKQLI